MSDRIRIARDDHRAIPSEVIDSFFDREMDDASRDKFFAMLRADVKACEDVVRTQRAVSALREPVESPELSGAILARLDERRHFLPARMRAMVTGGRAAAAAGLLLGLLAISLIQRYAPDGVSLVEAPSPVSKLASRSASDAAAGVQHLAGAMESVAARVADQSGKPRWGAVRQVSPLVAAPTTVRVAIRERSDIVIYGGAGDDPRFLTLPSASAPRRTARGGGVFAVNGVDRMGEDLLMVPVLTRGLGGHIDLIKTPDGP